MHELAPRHIVTPGPTHLRAMRIAAIALASLAAAGCSRSSAGYVELEGGRLQLPAGFALDPEAQRRALETAEATTPDGLEKVQSWVDVQSRARVALQYQDVTTSMPPRASVERLFADVESATAAAGYQVQSPPLELHDTWARFQLTASAPLLGPVAMYSREIAGVTPSGHVLAWTASCIAPDATVCGAILGTFDVDAKQLSALRRIE